MSDLIFVVLAKLFVAGLGLLWFAYHLHRFRTWQQKRDQAPVRFWLISIYSVGCMIFGLGLAAMALFSGLLPG